MNMELGMDPSIHGLLGRLHLGQVSLERLHEVLEVAPRHLGEVLELLLVPLGHLGRGFALGGGVELLPLPLGVAVEALQRPVGVAL